MLRSLVAVVIVARLATASNVICPGSAVVEATYDPGTGLLPEDSDPAWTLTSDNGSVVELGTFNGEPVLRVTDADLPLLGGSCADSGGMTYALSDDTFSQAAIYGAEARLRVTSDNACGRGYAAFGIADGARFIVVGVSLGEAAFLDASGAQGVAVIGQPVAVGDTTAMHTYSLRCERGLRCELFVDGAATPLLSIAYGAAPAISQFPPDFDVPFSSGVVAFHTERSLVEWAKLEAVSCAGDCVAVAKNAVQATAANIAAILPALRATQINHQLAGNGGATVKLAQAQAFLAQGKTADAIGKIAAAGDKVENASAQLLGYPTCPGGRNCVTPSAQSQSFTLVNVAKMQVAQSMTCTCVASPATAGCPAAPAILAAWRVDVDPNDSFLESLCIGSDRVVASISLACQRVAGSLAVPAVATSTQGQSLACASNVALPHGCGAVSPFSLTLVAVGETGLASTPVLDCLRRVGAPAATRAA